MEIGIKKTDKSVPSRCLHQTIIKNPYTDEYMVASCGHCEACLNAKSTMYVTRICRECKQNKYNIYFTLTYDNDSIPYIKTSDRDFITPDGEVIPSMFFSSKEDASFTRIGFAKSFDFTKDLYFPRITPSKIGGNNDVCQYTACVSRSDIQKFLKRLRIKLKREVLKINPNAEEKEYTLRYFIVSEYGPETFRPHYHGTLHTDSEYLAQNIDRLLSESWPFDSPDRHKVSFIEGGAPQYVASYCNSFADLPQILLLPSFRPFVLQSKNPLIGYKKENRKAVQRRVLERDFTEQGFDERSGQIVVHPFPKQVVDKYFHQLPHAFGISDKDRVSIFMPVTWQRFFQGDKGVLPTDFLISLTRFRIGRMPYNKVCDLYKRGTSWLKCLQIYDYPTYRCIMDYFLNIDCGYGFGTIDGIKDYIGLLHSISDAYFNMTMEHFYFVQDNYRKRFGVNDFQNLFYPIRYRDLRLLGKNAVKVWNERLSVDNLAVRLSNDEQKAIFVKKSMLKKHNDSKYSQVALYDH